METDRTTCVGEGACLAMREGTTVTTAFLASVRLPTRSEAR
ncbi:ABC-2 family transporter protein OS=Streptomyces microflavus OX=1919 GN=Smic_63630 PE=4 SV=1 [Streptomyces microflavus]